jgi:hypothetical protein
MVSATSFDPQKTQSGILYPCHLIGELIGTSQLIIDVSPGLFATPPAGSQTRLLSDIRLYEANQPVLADFVEKASDVGVQYEVHFRAGDANHQRIQRIMLTAFRSEPIRETKRQSGWEHVLPHPSMFPDVDAIASLECSPVISSECSRKIQLVDPLGR